MQREIITTADGSHSLALPGRNITYHSRHGAIAEGMHVFIEAGYRYLRMQQSYHPLSILEIGLGTGLNALLTMREAIKDKQSVHYTAIETAPLNSEEYTQLNHGELLSMNPAFLQLHQSAWEEDVQLDPYFTVQKRNVSLENFLWKEPVDGIYFDAFAPDDQPEMWTTEIFRKLFHTLTTGGILVTYSSKTLIRKAMQEAGFTVTKIPGPMGKRDMVRAIKP